MPVIPPTHRAVLSGAEPALRDLVRDVLAEAGVALLPEGQPGPADLWVVVPRRGAAVAPQVGEAVAAASPAPVVVLLPFTDERLAQEALAAGARGAASVWGSLDGLRGLVAEALGPALRPAGGTR